MSQFKLPSKRPGTKIVATIGPSTWDDDVLKRMIDLGVTVARINASFADHDELRRVLRQIRKLSSHVAVMADTQGHKIRINKISKPFFIKNDEIINIGARPGDGDIWVDYGNFLNDIKEGDRVLIDDGNIHLKVRSIEKDFAECIVEFGGELRPLKTVNLPDTHLSFPPLTEKDKKDIEFAVKQEFDFIAASFIRNIKDVSAIKEYTMGTGTKIIAKIENAEGIENFDAILAEVDGIMVARGDLGVEMAPERVPLLQKEMIYKCRKVGKPVIVATQMLESMRENASPTRAEINDVANAVFDGTDAVMLSAETSSGKHPVEAVSYMARACLAAEEACVPDIMPENSPIASVETDAIARSVIDLTLELPINKIVVGTGSGTTVASIARHRPDIGVLAFVPSEMLMRQLNIFRNVTPVLVEEDLPSDRDWLVRALAQHGVNHRYLRAEDMVIMVTGSGIAGKSRNSIVEVAKVFDVCEI
jgi:pyruvate kinase